MRPRGLLEERGGRQRFRRLLLRWYREHRRPLPWRGTRDPYRVLVSELMLQQTRVATVIPYYRKFVERFPTLEALAAADLDEVLAAWSGLGYYRRARHLHAAARRIVEEHGGRFPRDARAVRELPGVGRYTVGAVRSIAFGEPDPIVDGNVARVLCRVLGIEGDPRTPPVQAQLWDAAEKLVDPEHPGDFNQALMELGATVCAPASPDCSCCPCRGVCVAQATNRQGVLPRRTPRPAPRNEAAAVAVFRRRGRCLLVQRRGETLMDGLWEFPGDGGGGDPATLSGALRRRHRLWAEVGEPLGEVRHGILDRRIRLGVFRGRLLRPPSATAGRGGWRWVAPQAALDGEVALSAAARKVLRLVGAAA